MRIHLILIGIAITSCVCGSHANASDSDPFFNDKSAECQFLAGAWEGYVAGLTASADRDAEFKTTVAIWFHRLQRGLPANLRAYENLKQKSSDTEEHKASFLQVEKAARLIEKAFVKRFSKPTSLDHYEVGPERMDRPKRPNKASETAPMQLVDVRVQKGEQTLTLSAHGPNWVDEILKQVKSDQVIDMELVGEGWNDEEITKLQQFPSLEGLSIINAPLTDTAVTRLAKLPKLKRLYLENTKITDQCVVEFSRSPALQWLGIPGTSPSEAAIQKLIEAAPKLKIERAYLL